MNLLFYLGRYPQVPNEAAVKYFLSQCTSIQEVGELKRHNPEICKL